MNAKILNLTSAIALATCFSISAHATSIVNGSFETGDLSGWSNSANTSAASISNGYTATDGNYFALLTTGLGQSVYSTMSQTFSATTGNMLSLKAFFKTDDYLPFNDNSYINLLDSGNTLVATLFAADVANVGDLSGTPWTAVSYTFLTSGDFTLEFGVANQVDNDPDYNSYLGVDQISVSTVPAPPALLLFGSGLLSLLGMQKKRSLAA